MRERLVLSRRAFVEMGERELPYRFTDVDSLQSDFWAELKKRRRGK